jgi:hypothetical protein
MFLWLLSSGFSLLIPDGMSYVLSIFMNFSWKKNYNETLQNEKGVTISPLFSKLMNSLFELCYWLTLHNTF